MGIDREASEVEASPATDALKDDFGWALRSVSMAFETLARDVVMDIPAGPRGYLVLVAVSRAEARSQLTLAERLAIDKTQMTAVLDALQAEKLVVRVPDPNDRRARLVRITKRGEQRLKRAQNSLHDAEEYLLGPLGGDERTVLRRLISQVASAAVDRVTPHPDYVRGDAPPRRGRRPSA